MADIVLTHSAKGTSWQKKGASYIKREKKNGKWVYTYNNHNVPSNTSISNREQDVNKPRYDYIDRKGKLHMYLPQSKKVLHDKYSDIETDKRKSVSAQRNVQKDTRYKINAKTAYLKNKASRNINKGKKKVSELLERLKKQASASVAKAKQKVTRLKKKYIVGEPGKVYPVNSAKEKAEYERIRRKKMKKSRKFIEDYIIGHEGKVTTH